jgi:L-ascorbate metabolism protein UlaG (beta-lactamase superfamily)
MPVINQPRSISCAFLIKAGLTMMLLLVSACVAVPAEQAELSITYVCNEGFIITTAGKKILVDALYQESGTVCRPDLPQLASDGLPPFEDADLVLVSHSHSDHFDARIVGQYLVNTPGAILVVEKSAADQLSQRFGDFKLVQNRVNSIELGSGQQASLSFDGIELGIFSAPGDVPNLAFLVQAGGNKLFHTGDMYINYQTTVDFQAYDLTGRRIDIAFVPYIFLYEDEDLTFIEKFIGAKNYIPMHYAAEGGVNILNLVRNSFPGAILFEEPMQVWTRSN